MCFVSELCTWTKISTPPRLAMTVSYVPARVTRVYSVAVAPLISVTVMNPQNVSSGEVLMFCRTKQNNNQINSRAILDKCC
jgi:hypothetical protein